MSLFAPWSLRDLVSDLEAGETTGALAHQQAHERIAETESDVHAWVAVRPDDLPESLPGGRGIPLGVKDIIDVRGFPTRCGSELRTDAAAEQQDAPVVDAWRKAGMEPLGKTVTTEFAYFQPGPTCNPAASGRTPGGSSSGSAAAVASGQVPFALGTQTAASVIRPASFCGVAALVVTRGALSTEGVYGLAESLDSQGFFGAEVRDIATGWSLLKGEALVQPRRPERVLLWDAAALGPVSSEMSSAVAHSADVLEDLDVPILPLGHTGLIAQLVEAHRVVMAYEAARARADARDNPDRISEPLRTLIEAGVATASSEYGEALAVIGAAGVRLNEVIHPGDVILGAGALGAAPLGLSSTGDPLLSRPWQALGVPVLAIPGARDREGSPLGLQAIGSPARDADLIARGMWIEDALR